MVGAIIFSNDLAREKEGFSWNWWSLVSMSYVSEIREQKIERTKQEQKNTTLLTQVHLPTPVSVDVAVVKTVYFYE